jgi:hypothetical protein
MGATGDQNDVVAVLGEPAAHDAADGTRPVDDEPHGESLPYGAA